MKKLNKTCTICKKELDRRNKSGLCQQCYRKSLVGKNNPMFGKTGKDNPNYKDGRTLYKHYCIECGKEIHWCTASYSSSHCLNCSKKGSRNPNFKHGLFKCKLCNKEFTSKKTVTGICRTCSIGKNHWSYFHGQYKMPYPIEFNKRLKIKIRERDYYTCQCCGLRETDRSLDIHHIDYNKNNCKNSNLITVCGNCNRKANFNRDYWYTYYKYIMENK